MNCSDKVYSYHPIKWNEYFNIRDDIELEVGTFRIYRRGVEGPLLFFIHGGGFSALSWAILSSLITNQVKCQCLAVDMRGHGDSKCQDNEDLSVDTLAKDIIKIIFAMYPTEAPPIILVGHSMGGAVAVHVACKGTIPSLAGLVVIDVVEGSAMSCLHQMTSFLNNRPQSFRSLCHAIEWSVRSHQIQNIQSARVSFPGQLKRIKTNQTATSELDQGIALINDTSYTKSNKFIPSIGNPLPEAVSLEESEEEHNDDFSDNHNSNSESHCAVSEVTNETNVSIDSLPPLLSSNSHVRPVSSDSNKLKHLDQFKPIHPHHSSKPGEYTWRIDLLKTQPFWQGWFAGLSKLFLSIPEPKLLLLTNMDRLDKDLMIAQRQGKFQVHVFPRSGHAVQEDAPEQVAECLARFLVHNRFTEARSNCEQ